MQLTPDERASLSGDRGDIMQMAYRILVATAEATDAERLIPVRWVHLSGVNYNTIGDAGEEFLRSIRDRARVAVRTTLNPAGFDIDTVHDYDLDNEFVRKQTSILESYAKMGVDMSLSCIPYDIVQMPPEGSQVALAESNAAIHANTFDGLMTNKESAFSALASALTGKSPSSPLREDTDTETAIVTRCHMKDELDWGLLGYFAGKTVESTTVVCDRQPTGRRNCKALCGGMGTSGICAKVVFGPPPTGCEKIEFDADKADDIRDELNTAESGDIIILGSPQLSLPEISDLVSRLNGRRFAKNCMIFCPRTVKSKITTLGYKDVLERANCTLLSDCCACLTPLVSRKDTDSVVTNSIKGAYYLGRSNNVGVALKSLHDIIRTETI